MNFPRANPSCCIMHCTSRNQAFSAFLLYYCSVCLILDTLQTLNFELSLKIGVYPVRVTENRCISLHGNHMQLQSCLSGENLHIPGIPTAQFCTLDQATRKLISILCVPWQPLNFRYNQCFDYRIRSQCPQNIISFPCIGLFPRHETSFWTGY